MKRKNLKSSSPLCYRAGAIEIRDHVGDGAVEEVKRGILTTEQPVNMFDWERWEEVPEVLVMSGMTARGLSLKLVDSHNTGSVQNVLGSFEKIRKHKASDTTPHAFVDGEIRVSSVHPDIATKIREGHINEMSVGYSIEESTYVPKDENQKIGGVTYEGPVNVRTKWTAHEASLVALGADSQAQIRGYNSMAEAMGAKSKPEQQPEEPELDTLENVVEASRSISNPNQPANTMSTETTNTSAGLPPALSTATTTSNAQPDLAAERARTTAIADLADSYGCREDGRKAIADGMPVEHFVSSLRGRAPQSGPTIAAPIPWSEREAKTWSLARAAQCLADGRKVDGLEAEVSQEIARRTNKSTRGFFIPSQQDIAQFGRAVTTTMLAGTATDGAELVPTRTLTDRYLPFFQPKPVMWALGATVITGITENFAVPKQTSARPTAAPAAEDTAHAEDGPQFASVSFSPHAYGFFTEVSKRLLYQSPAAVEQILRNMMNSEIAIAFDLDGINGSGSGECDGIISHADASTVTITTAGSPDFDEILEFESDIETSNALEGSLAYLTTPAIKKHMKKTAEYGTDRNPMWTTQMVGLGESMGVVNGYRGVSSNQSPSNSIIFGDFSKYWYAIFDGIEITVTEDAGLAKRRSVQFCCNIDIDGKPVQGQAFSHNV